MNNKYYPHIRIGAVITAIVVIIIFIIVFMNRDKIISYVKSFFSTETFDDNLLNAVYYNPTNRKINDNLTVVDGMDIKVNEPQPNFDSMSYINNNVSDYAYLDNVLDDRDTQVAGPANVASPVPASPVIPAAATPSDNREQPIIQTKSDNYLIDDGANGTLVFDYNTCSKSCCATNVWPVPFYVPEEEKNSNYVPTNMFCSNSISNGCVCATPKQIYNLQTRGGNSPNY
jgi:hypothetical protein